jgi:signal transduction histidine kinase
MISKTIRSLFVFALCLLFARAQAKEGTHSLMLEKCSVYVGDPNLPIAEIAASQNYKTTPHGAPNLGLSNDWQYVQFDYENSSNEDELFCYIGNSSIEHIELYKIGSTLELIGVTGSTQSNATPFETPSGFSMELPNESGRYMLRMHSSKQLIAPVYIGESNQILRMAGKEDAIMFLYFGIIAVLFFYNLFLAIATRERGYSDYSFYILSIALTQAVLFGYGNTYLWAGNEWFGRNGVHIMGAVSGITTILFTRSFLRLKEHTPVIDKILQGYAVLYCAALALCFAGFGIESYNVINFCAASSILLIIASLKARKKGNRSAGFFLLSWSVFIVACTIFAMKDFGVLPYNFYTVYSLPFGSAIEGVLLSFALADKINVLRKQKEEADAQRIKTIESQNELLETKVHQRTAQLEEAKDYIQSQYDHLRLTQKQLVESEKLAGLGQMTAGIAHELNNPINFVNSNVGPLQRDIADVLSMLDAYQALGPDATQNDLEMLKKRCEELDIQFLRKEIAQLVQGIEEGSKRTAEIVKGLRIFARTDKDTLIAANINECIQSTLVVMKGVTKGQVTVHKQLATDIPDVDCFPGKLNQVIANLVSNAIHATRIPGRNAIQRNIWISSEHDSDFVRIRVKDDGCGIDAQEVEKIFVPFFTTKAVGEGTGLGLAIARGIIEEHKGQIEVVSQPGKGTEFILHLPRNRNQETRSAA